MDLLTAFLLALSLSMDSFAVAISQGIQIRHKKFLAAIKIGIIFGLVQATMPLVGYGVGKSLSQIIIEINHFVAFILLSGIGCKMIYESLYGKKDQTAKKLNHKTIFLLAVITSIDALVIGVTFGILGSDFVKAAAIIGVTTMIVSFLGARLGDRLGSIFSERIEIVGGLVLIGIGLKILIENMF